MYDLNFLFAHLTFLNTPAVLTIKFQLQGGNTGQKLKYLDRNDWGGVTDVPQKMPLRRHCTLDGFTISIVLYIFDTRVMAKISSSETYVQSSRYNMCTHHRPNVRVKTKRFSSIERWPTRVRIDVDIGDKIGLCEWKTPQNSATRITIRLIVNIRVQLVLLLWNRKKGDEGDEHVLIWKIQNINRFFSIVYTSVRRMKKLIFTYSLPYRKIYCATASVRPR